MEKLFDFIDQLRAEKGKTETFVNGNYYKFSFKVTLEVVGRAITLTVYSPIEIVASSREKALEKVNEKYRKISVEEFPERVKLLIKTLGDQVEVGYPSTIMGRRTGGGLSNEVISIDIKDHEKVFTSSDINKIIGYIKNTAISNNASVKIIKDCSPQDIRNDRRRYGDLLITESDGFITRLFIHVDRT